MHRSSSVRWLCVAVLAAIAFPRPVHAVGWDSDDFLITGAPNFPQYIGVFDHDFTFKGYLETNFLGVQGMDFDRQGNLVAIASLGTTAQVRVYSPGGSKIGGFSVANAALQDTGDLKVAPDGNYALGTNTSGVQVYSPAGQFVRQYGSGNDQAITYLPGNRLWAGGTGSTIRVFDTVSGLQTGTFTADGQTQSTSMQYNSLTNSVLVTDSFAGPTGIFERDLAGNISHQFTIPATPSRVITATVGPDGDIFAATGKNKVGLSDYYDVVAWSADGSFKERILSYPIDVSAVQILWAGNAPEPGGLSMLVIFASLLGRSTRIR